MTALEEKELLTTFVNKHGYDKAAVMELINRANYLKYDLYESAAWILGGLEYFKERKYENKIVDKDEYIVNFNNFIHTKKESNYLKQIRMIIDYITHNRLDPHTTIEKFIRGIDENYFLDNKDFFVDSNSIFFNYIDEIGINKYDLANKLDMIYEEINNKYSDSFFFAKMINPINKSCNEYHSYLSVADFLITNKEIVNNSSKEEAISRLFSIDFLLGYYEGYLGCNSYIDFINNDYVPDDFKNYDVYEGIELSIDAYKGKKREKQRLS